MIQQPGYRQFIPHSIEDRAYWGRVGSAPQYAALRGQVEKMSGAAAPRGSQPSATDYLADKRFNDRMPVTKHWHSERSYLVALAFRACMRGIGATGADTKEDDQVLNWMWDCLSAPTWAVSGHLRGKDLPLLSEQTIDLATCDMAGTFTEMLEVMKPWMDSQAASLAGSVVHEIDRRVLTPFGEGSDEWWADPKIRSINWSGVCGGTILAMCESMGRMGYPRPKPRARALEVLRRFIDEGFTETGECDEGIVYWAFGLGMACVGLDRLSEEELHRNIDMARLRQVAEYPRRIHLIGDIFFSGNDASLHYTPEVYFIPWLAGAVGSSWLMEWGRSVRGYSMNNWPRAMRNLEAIDIFSEMPRMGSFGFDGEEESAAAMSEEARRPRYLADQQVAMLQTASARGEFIACLSGGNNDERHNHNDLGQFLILVGKSIVVIDLAKPDYPADFFGPNRYKYLSASSRGHNCPIIDGFEQRAGAEAQGKVVAWEPAAGRAKFSLELGSAYPPEAGLVSWTRTLEQRDGRFFFTDHYKTKGPGVGIEHVVWVSIAPELRKGGGGWTAGALRCDLSPGEVAGEVTAIDPKEHWLRDWKDSALYRIAARFKTDERGELVVAGEYSVV